jgi:hypothetical protein
VPLKNLQSFRLKEHGTPCPKGWNVVMQTQNGFMGSADYEKMFQLREESEKLLNNVAVLRRMLWEIRANLHHLEQLCEEVKDSRAAVDCLQAQIDAMAERFQLQPNPAEDTRT